MLLPDFDDTTSGTGRVSPSFDRMLGCVCPLYHIHLDVARNISYSDHRVCRKLFHRSIVLLGGTRGRGFEVPNTMDRGTTSDEYQRVIFSDGLSRM
jgi:hypothetical protein